MKNLMYLAGILLAINSFGQVQEMKDDQFQMPCLNMVSSGYPEQNIDDFLRKNVNYPEISVERKTQGTEIIQFTVTPEGRLIKYKVINSVSPEIDKELFRVLRLTNGKWTPGMQDSKAVEMKYEISVNFFLYPKQFIVADANDYLQKGNKLMYSKQKPRKAMYYYDKGITLLPNNETLLAARGLCKYRLGDKKGANRDWNRLKVLAQRNNDLTELEKLAEKLPDIPGLKVMKAKTVSSDLE